MAKTPMKCPFSEKMCEECQLYRGRHYYMCVNEHYRGYIKPKHKVEIKGPAGNIDLNTIKRLFEPWSVAGDSAKIPQIKMKIKVILREDNSERYVELAEAKDWDWKNKFMMRLVNGKHVTSWEEFLEIVRYQEEKGTEELVVFEAPAFMLM